MMQPIYKPDKPENITNSLFGALKDSNINQTDYKRISFS
jgi:hypothetical protein